MPRTAPHLVKLSDALFADAQRGQLSSRGRLDAMFEAGYAAIMAFADANDLRKEQHPSLKPARKLCRVLDLQICVPCAYLENKLASDDKSLPSFEAVEAWTFACRRRLSE